MTGRTELRVREIGCRVQRYRLRYAHRILRRLSVCTLLLLAGIGGLLHQVDTPGVSAVAQGYSTVLLRNGAGGYVVTGIAAFISGAVVTVICIRLQRNVSKYRNRTKGSEE